MTAIPMAMGFAMAAGLRPEQGIITCAVACLVGRTFGGSKYQVYGPTAAFIPVIASLIRRYDHTFLVPTSGFAGAILTLIELAGSGRIVRLVPNSIVVGFTAGIGVTIALTNLDSLPGLRMEGRGLLGMMTGIASQASLINPYAVVIGWATSAVTRYLLRVSIFIPAPECSRGLPPASRPAPSHHSRGPSRVS